MKSTASAQDVAETFLESYHQFQTVNIDHPVDNSYPEIEAQREDVWKILNDIVFEVYSVIMSPESRSGLVYEIYTHLKNNTKESLEAEPLVRSFRDAIDDLVSMAAVVTSKEEKGRMTPNEVEEELPCDEGRLIASIEDDNTPPIALAEEDTNTEGVGHLSDEELGLRERQTPMLLDDQEVTETDDEVGEVG